MLSLKGIFRSVVNRRRLQQPVETERRKRLRPREAETRLTNAISDLSKMVRSKTRDSVRAVANDVQAVVKFMTFAEICTLRVPGVNVRMCRHPKHESANTGKAFCTEELCPVMRGELA